MRLVIITGMSGAGKSCTIRAFEDMGYSCVDNIPPELIEKFSDIFSAPNCSINKMALVVDSRSAELFSGLPTALDRLSAAAIPFDLLFLDTGDEVLLNRYKETRRRHPLISQASGSLKQAIALERVKMKTARDRADFVIDTTDLSPKALTKRLLQLFNTEQTDIMDVSVVSFGYKHGLPSDADLVIDVRCLPNPYYIENLRNQRGFDKDVYDYVFQWDVAQELRTKIEELLSLLLPLYSEEGKSSLVIAFGCTGGHHRSVAFAEYFAKFCKDKGFQTFVTHRDSDK